MEVYKRKVDTADELLASILDAAGCIIETWRSTETNKTRSSTHELKSELRLTVGILGTFIVDCNRFISV